MSKSKLSPEMLRVLRVLRDEPSAYLRGRLCSSRTIEALLERKLITRGPMVSYPLTGAGKRAAFQIQAEPVNVTNSEETRAAIAAGKEPGALARIMMSPEADDAVTRARTAVKEMEMDDAVEPKRIRREVRMSVRLPVLVTIVVEGNDDPDDRGWEIQSADMDMIQHGLSAQTVTEALDADDELEELDRLAELAEDLA